MSKHVCGWHDVKTGRKKKAKKKRINKPGMENTKMHTKNSVSKIQIEEYK
jgi:hypothetical protein